ncbi:unnamed protein product, partial [Allacma fusca]
IEETLEREFARWRPYIRVSNGKRRNYIDDLQMSWRPMFCKR